MKELHSLYKKILKEGYKYTDTSRDIGMTQISSHQINFDLEEGFPAVTTKKLYWRAVVGELLWFLRGDTNINYLLENNINIWNKDAYNFRMNSSNNPNGYYQAVCNINSLEDYLKACKEFPEDKIGNLGRVYGAQWRAFSKYGSYYEEYVDQISNLIKNLKENPMSRRHIVTAWNPAELDDMALPPCHWSFEIIVEPLSISRQPLFKKDDSKKGWTVNNDRSKYQFTLKWHQRSVDSFLGR